MFSKKKIYNYKSFFLNDLNEPNNKIQYLKLSNFEKKKIS